MEKVSGIGGLFSRARDPVAIGQWYRDHLGVDCEGNPIQLWEPEG
jgi:glyoxylase I family protein